MTKPIRIDAEADDEISHAIDRYEREREGLGAEFWDELKAAMRTLEDLAILHEAPADHRQMPQLGSSITSRVSAYPHSRIRRDAAVHRCEPLAIPVGRVVRARAASGSIHLELVTGKHRSCPPQSLGGGPCAKH